MLFAQEPHWPFCDYDVENKCGLLKRLVTGTRNSLFAKVPV